ncbi:hypothetical protein EIP86_007712 [Pleurotus ostreatoroseus]|nr:hypothetical protein EIP86_007712 [Pleurotus ostreatoroseus]
MSSTRIPLLLGAGLMGLPGSGARFTDVQEVQQWVNVMVQHGQPFIDCARAYGGGTAEKLISQLDLKGVRVDTKIAPLAPGDFAPARVKELAELSREALGPNIKIRVFYLHAPDRSVPFEDTLEAVNDLYKEGLFEELGLSNYMSWEVAEIVGICKRRGFVAPTVYQGQYNVLYRTPEDEPNAPTHSGGLLTGKLLGAPPAPGSHFDPSSRVGALYTQRFAHAQAAAKLLRGFARRHDLALIDVAYRWLQHHSAMGPEDHGMIVGGSSVAQIEEAVVKCEQGPLPDDLVAACDKAWKAVRGHAPGYWQ